MVRVNLVINVLMGRVRAPARLRIYVSEWQKSQFTSCVKEKVIPTLAISTTIRIISKSH